MNSEISFDESRHLYFVDGKVIPSVTQILTHNKPNFYKDNGADVTGTVVHKMLEEYDITGDADFYGEYYQRYLKHYESFRNDYGSLWKFIEHKVFHRDLVYCGTVDRGGYIESNGWHNLRPAVIDLKTGSSVPEWASLQTAAYAMALFPQSYKDCFRAVLHINPNKLKAYKLKVYEDASDFLRWEYSCKKYHREMQEMEERQ